MQYNTELWYSKYTVQLLLSASILYCVSIKRAICLFTGLPVICIQYLLYTVLVPLYPENWMNDISDRIPAILAL